MRPAPFRAVHVLMALASVLLISLAFASKRNQPHSWQSPSRSGRAEAARELREPAARPANADKPAAGPWAAAQIDTVLLARYTFDGRSGPDPQGWTSHDRGAQEGTFFHVDDFAGLGGGDFGALTPLSGSRSMWCGLRPSASYCHYARLPGYGDLWSQELTSAPIPVTGDVTIQFEAMFDSEYNYDWTDLHYQSKNNIWQPLLTYLWEDSLGGAPLTGTFSAAVPADSISGSVTFRFKFQSDGAWSDQDGLRNSDGALIIDDLTVSDTTGIIDFQDFESEPVGATETLDGNWTAGPTPGFGDYAGLFDGNTVLQEDSLVTNTTYLWGFFNGSPDTYECGSHPGQPAVPYAVNGTYIRNEIRSPWIPLNLDPSGIERTLGLTFDVYADLPRDNLVHYEWRVRFRTTLCPSQWFSNNGVYYNDDTTRVWLRPFLDLSQYVPAGADEVQVALGVVDTCPWFCGIYGTGSCHTHAPLFDNVEVIAIQRSYAVTNTNDTGPGSLRRAITEANSDSLRAFVTFNIPGVGPHVIQPLTALPVIGSNIVIDGYSQPKSKRNTNPIDQRNNADIQIVIDGSNFSPPGISGLIMDGGNSVISGLAVGNYPRNGIQVQSNNNTVAGCFIGIDPDGASDIGNGNGVLISIDDMNNTVGGSDPQDYNVITHNTGVGVYLHSNARTSVVQGNFVGLTADGRSAPGNGTQGVYVNNANECVIGGTNASERNVISGNMYGVYVLDADSLTIDGNRIGTNRAGLGSFGNTNDGIFVTANSAAISVGSVAAGNLIASNGRDGIRTDPSHVGWMTILGNSIDLNGALGIDLGGDGISGTDAPTLTAVTPVAQNAVVDATITYSNPNQWIGVDFYESPACDPSGFGEGSRYLSSYNVFIGFTGTEVFAAPIFNPTPGWYITAMTRGASEFSNCREFINTPVGSDVPVAVGDDGTGNPQAKLTFDEVTGQGATSIAASDTCEGLPGQFISADSTCWNLTTNATFIDSITVCLHYDETLVTGAESDLVLMHYDASLMDWFDITTSVDTVANLICGRSLTLSPFLVAEPNPLIGAPGRTGIPAIASLHQNYPNPFNPVTTITYEVPPGAGRVTIAVYDVAGRLVQRLVDRDQPGGIWEVTWDGRNTRGRQVSSGVYFYRMRAGSFTETRKMVLLK